MNLSIEKLNGWNSGLSSVLLNVGENTFPDGLVKCLKHLIDFDVCMVFAYGDEQGSAVLHHNMFGKQAEILVDQYLMGPHLLDPFFAEATSGRKNGFKSMRELAPDQFYRSEFYRHHYIRTGIADEIGVFFPVGEGRNAVLSVTRQKPKRLFSETEKSRFASAAPIIEAYGSKHWGPTSYKNNLQSSSRTIKEVFESFGEDTLTLREREIISLVLKGHSSISIGQVLSISSGTVKIHRKNAYSKLGVASQAELFSMFLSLLQKKLDQ